MLGEDLPKVVAIVGSRSWPPTKRYWIDTLVKRLKPDTIVVSGGASGVDTFARDAVSLRRDLHYKPMHVEPFEWKLLGKGVGHHRNAQIVLYLKKYSGHMIIFAVKEEFDAAKGGSYNDAALCERYKVPFTLIFDTAEVLEGGQHDA